MKNVQSLLLRSARSSRRPVAITRSITFARARNSFASPRNFSFTANAKEDDLTMAPKGQRFELKTPKGTKDCKLLSSGLGHY